MNKIGIFTDSHALYEPTEAVIEDMKKNGIKKIYSLGDNIGVGPSPKQVLDLLRDNNVTSIAGNNEEYFNLGIAPFKWYFDKNYYDDYNYTASMLNADDLKYMKTFKHSVDLAMGGKKIALCHYANDLRIDSSDDMGPGAYKNIIENYGKGYKLFTYTNSDEEKENLEHDVKNSKGKGFDNGIISAYKEPIFDGKTIDMYDAIFQGHVHFKIDEETPFNMIYTLRAVGMPCGYSSLDKAYYVTLEETPTGVKKEEHLVTFDREKMVYVINNCPYNNKKIKTFTSVR